MGLLKRYKEWRSYEKRAQTLEELLLEVGIGTDKVTKEQALSIPAVNTAVNIISDTIAMLPIYLYKEDNGKVSIVNGDNRVKLLNDDTKDTLDAFQWKKAMIEDYILSGVGYSFINKERNNVASLHYVDNAVVSVNKNTDPIFKDYNILVNGKTYRPFEFIKLTRKTKDGVTGRGIVDENNDALTVSYLTMKYEKVLLRTGGNKKGFLQAEKRLDPDAMKALKTAWNNLYKDNTESVVVLNEGMTFKEATATSVEMQMNESKQTNADQISKLFGMPNGILDENTIKSTIIPLLVSFVTALNKDLLLESEKIQYYFAFDTKELLKGDMLKRYQAYEIAVKNGWMQWDEVRFQEDLEPYGLDFIKLGLQDVLFNPKTKEIYTPNTDKTSSLGKGGGELNSES